jgi:hypothetical protein
VFDVILTKKENVMSKIQELKIILKKLASEIKETKKKLKDYQRANNGYEGPFSIFSLKYEFRHKHIAYCLLRGTDRSKIETLPKNPNKKFVEANEDYIKEVMNEYTEVSQDVCISSQRSE